MDDKLTVIEDWAPANLSPGTFMANLLNEQFGSKPFSDLSAETGSYKSQFAFEKQQMSVNAKEECNEDGFNLSSNLSLESSLIDSQKSSSRGGLAQRKARSGFNALTINTSRVESANMASSSSEVPSPYLTIPPGLSPTTLLDSPVFLSNSMVQPSPTTGKLSFLCNSSNSVSISVSDPAVPDKNKDEHSEDIAAGGFAFKPLLSSSCFASSENKGSSAVGCQQSLQGTDLSFQNHSIPPAGFSESSARKESAVDTICPKPTDSFIGDEHSPPLEDQLDGEEDTKGEFSSTAVAAPMEDEYNWRKYGQKQVKGSEFPRSYYKCTHPSCPVKKKVERSHEGHITEIIYKGVHNHAKPLPNRRPVVPSSHPFNDANMDGLEHTGSQANLDGKPPLWTGNATDTTSFASIATEFGNRSASLQTQGSHFGSPEAIDVSYTVSNEEEEDEQVTRGSVSLGIEGEEDESESKRRKLDACPIEMNTGSRAVREPRVVVQTTSEVDILDDGYRWRKYGQKVVKGNPNPRSYYKCTSPGCPVRKHVERASHDLKSVITTYEGKHNHDVPAARNSSHSGTGSSIAAAAASTTHHRRLEPTQDSLMQLEGPAPLTNFSFPVRDQQLGLGSGFSFGMARGLNNLGIAGLGPMSQVKLPVLGPFHSYMGQQGSNTTSPGFMIPKGEPEDVSETGLPVPNGMAAYHQLLSRLPLGPHL